MRLSKYRKISMVVVKGILVLTAKSVYLLNVGKFSSQNGRKVHLSSQVIYDLLSHYQFSEDSRSANLFYVLIMYLTHLLSNAFSNVMDIKYMNRYFHMILSAVQEIRTTPYVFTQFPHGTTGNCSKYLPIEFVSKGYDFPAIPVYL